MGRQFRRVDAAVFQTFIWWLIATFSATIGTKTDVSCLKHIKDSLEDPHSRLSSWNFTGESNYTDGFVCAFLGVLCWNDVDGKVLKLDLSNLGLKGKFPRGIENCSSITALNLSNNNLEGPIPSDISKRLPYLTSLDLSSNKFSGQIPIDIANCSYLSVLNLANNTLFGHIPQQIGLLNRIKMFSVANNMLSGAVPIFVNATVSADSYANNGGLCGGPLESCREDSRELNLGFDYSFKSGFLFGYLVFAISGIVVYASYCVPWLQMGKRDEMMTVAAMIRLMINRMIKKTEFDDRFHSFSAMEFILEKEISTSENFVTRMSFKDLSYATENFSQKNMIGLGQMGTMYKATLPNGWSLAVKKMSNSEQAEEQFITELKTLGKLRHKNLISLIGFCKESRKRLLVYNHVSNRNLFDWLHSVDGKKNILKWPLRMKIAIGLARGLAWLHHCCDFRVAHLNITTNCILLDQNFEPKLSNFGMATLINPSEVNNSSRGFVIDIEFWEQCFVMEDVFSFGIVLLEQITGKKAHSITVSDKWITDLNSSSCFPYDEVDELLLGQGHDDEMFRLLRVAGNCVQPFPEQRPTMLDVYATLSLTGDRFHNLDS